MKKQMLIVVSFGTSVSETRQCVALVENDLRKQCPDLEFRRAFTSPTIRRILAKRGEIVFSLEEVLEQAVEQGYARIFIQPTHLICGFEYDKIQNMVQAYSQSFEELNLGEPLLTAENDLERLASILSGIYPEQAGEALVFMGHGTEHPANTMYYRMQERFHRMGRKDTFVGTVEGDCGVEDMIYALRTAGIQKAHLVPLLLVAGDHARNDMAGETEDSWKTIMEAHGIQVRCTLEGLGMQRDVRRMYCHKLAQLCAL